MNPFIVMDTRTGKEADPCQIVLKEDWAKEAGLCYCDMEGFFIGQDGTTLILADECGVFTFVDQERFKIIEQEAEG